VADPRPERGAKSKGRLEAFSDGVFAIAITLLVIEIAVPEHAGGRLLSALFEERPVYLAYFIAFMSIGIVCHPVPHEPDADRAGQVRRA
jgi:uncharacterized membrane protein